MVEIPESSVRRGVALLRAAMLHCLADFAIVDIAFIGNSSGAYHWIPSRIIDFDCFLFARRWGTDAGIVLAAAEDQARTEIEALGLDFEMRLIKGPYKPDRSPGQLPVICAHIGLFDDDRYREQSALSRWTWRKYTSVVEPTRLLRLAPQRPTMPDLIVEIRDRLQRLTDGRTTMTEYLLPSMEPRLLEFDSDATQFVEFCYSSASNVARHHARILGHAEADMLDNDGFFAWYQSAVLSNQELAELMKLKASSRNTGFGGLGSLPRELAIGYLAAVLAVAW